MRRSHSVSIPTGTAILALLLFFIGWSPLAAAAAAPEFNYLVGRGMTDITGPAVGIQMFGFVRADHITEGIHLRQRARAFVIADPTSDHRVALVIVDIGSVTYEIERSVVERLAAKYGDLYSAANVVVSATHTHSGPGGYWHYGAGTAIGPPFNGEYFDAIVDGITEAIVAAHESLAPGAILLAEGIVEEAGAQRSAVAYRANPREERARYEADTDRQMTLLKFVTAAGPIGTINWFAVHPTSMTFNNKLISSDNKGYAAYAFERLHGTRDAGPDRFVAAFAQSNAGDVTPNLNLDNTGPGSDEFESTRIIGQRQLDVALQLFAEASRPLGGPIDYRQAYVDFSGLAVEPEFTHSSDRQTSPSAYGYAFAAGSTEDGGGHPLFREGMTKRNPFIDNVVRRIMPLPAPSDDLRERHKPKVILLAPGAVKPPAQPQVLPLGIVRIGQLALIVGPAEFTTMSGRRIREAVLEALGGSVTDAVIVGYANAYAGYVTTYEEYQIQQYEGGHTLFGPWTQAAYQQEFVRLAKALAAGESVDPGPQPDDIRNRVPSRPLGTDYDLPPEDAAFGDVATDAAAEYASGDRVEVAFWTGHPQNGYVPGNNYLEIQRLVGDDWQTVATDADWETRVRWSQPASELVAAQQAASTDGAAEGAPGPSDPLAPPATQKTLDAHQVHIRWDMPADTPAGDYRIVHFGTYKSQDDAAIRPVVGTSRTFTVH